MKKLFHILFSLCLFLSLTSCDNSSKKSVTDTAAWSIEVGYPAQVMLSDGSNKYEITLENPDLANVTFEPTTYNSGILTIEGLKAGKTILTIRDKVDGHTLIVDLEIIIYEFIIDETEVNVTMFTEKDIPTVSGNRKYEISVKDKDIVNANIYETAVQEDGKTYFGITLSTTTPGITGNTEIYVKDVILDEIKTIKVSTTFPYLTLNTEQRTISVDIADTNQKTAIEADIAQKGLLQDGYVYTMLRDNKDMPLYIFKNMEDMRKGQFVEKGQFAFMIGASRGMFYTVNDVNHSLITRAPKSSYTTIFQLFDIYFIDTADNTVADNKIELTEDLTEKYKVLYPTLVSAKVQSVLSLFTPDEAALPLEMTQN